jgi:N-acetylglutamate synthase-like GNAT family acetyltransferase
LVEFRLRPAEKNDFPAIRSLIHTVGINPTGLHWRRFIVAISAKSEILGCGQIKPHSDGSLELASIAVTVKARGTGIARAIIENLLSRETTRPIYLMCRAKLEPLYNKFEFRVINMEEMPQYFRRIHHLAKIINLNSSPEEQLIVMRLQ